MTKFTVISGKASEQLAKKIAAKLKAKFLKSELKIFPDGERKITISSKLPKSKIVVVQSTYPLVDSNLIQALSLVSKANRRTKANHHHASGDDKILGDARSGS